jgi:hypothetical protein
VDGVGLSDRADPDKVAERARELLDGGAEGRASVAEDEASAQRAARRILDDSAARTEDPAARDPEDDGVIRRTSGEIADV